MTKKILLGLIAVVAVAGGVAGMSAFEAHVINVTAKIENALSVETTPIDFGTVFPQETLYEDITISLSDSFIAENRVDDVAYYIKQKPKPRLDVQFPEGIPGHEYCLESWNNAWDNFMFCWDESGLDFIEGWEACKYVLYLNPYDEDPTLRGYDRNLCYPMLCPFLSKTPQDGEEGDYGVSAPHFPCTEPAAGYLSKMDEDTADLWTIDLVVPCFQGMCDQGYNWWEYGPPLNPALEHQTFGCDLWIEIYDISEYSEVGSCGDGYVGGDEECEIDEDCQYPEYVCDACMCVPNNID